MAAVHVVIDSQGFWDRNGAAISGLATVVLAGLTAVYVWLTLRLTNADTEALKAAREANRLARRSLDLATQERVDSETPAAAVYAMDSTWEPQQQGPVRPVDDPGTLVKLKLTCGFFANGCQPIVVQCDPPLLGEWSQLRQVLIPDNGVYRGQLVWTLTATAQAFQRLANERHRLTLTFHTRAPAGGAMDTHTWTGTFSGIELINQDYQLRDRAFDQLEEPWEQRRKYQREVDPD